MKSLLLATAAVAAFAAAPALAQDGPVGSFGVTYSDSEVELGGLSADADAWSVDGVVAIPAFGAWTVTVAGVASDNDDDTMVSGNVHLTTMAGSDVRFGGFVGAADVADETALTAGFEAQKYLSRATLTGVVAYTTLDDVDVDVWSVGGARPSTSPTPCA